MTYPKFSAILTRKILQNNWEQNFSSMKVIYFNNKFLTLLTRLYLMIRAISWCPQVSNCDSSETISLFS